MTTMMMTTNPICRPSWARVALGAIAAVAMLLPGLVQADGYGFRGYSSGSYGGNGYSGGGNYGGNYGGKGSSGHYGGGHGGSGYHGGGYKPSPAPVQNTYRGGGRSYSAYYRSGNGGFGWLNYNRGQNTNTGYYGPGGGNNTPHRGDWYAKLQAQRRWDEQQFKKSQQGRGGAECGLSGAPAYCYKLMGPYPTEMKIVRY